MTPPPKPGEWGKWTHGAHLCHTVHIATPARWELTVERDTPRTRECVIVGALKIHGITAGYMYVVTRMGKKRAQEIAERLAWAIWEVTHA